MREPDKTAPGQDWFPELLTTEALELVGTEYEVLRLMRRCTSTFGFSHFLVTRFPDGERPRFSERLLVSSWPAELVRSYDELGVFHISRLVAEVAVTKRPVLMDGTFLAPKETLQMEESGATGLVERFGLEGSLAFLLHSTAGEAFIVVYSGKQSALESAELARIYFSTVQLFECLERTFAAGPTTREKLSGREIECLRWAAAGKSSDEIAIILGISAYTVSSYFKTAAKKLGAVNRMQAIASAMRLKLI